jgi:hypothetical protein
VNYEIARKILDEDGYKIDLENGGIQYLPDLYRINESLFNVEDESGTEPAFNRDRLASFKVRVAEVRARRRMFRAQKNYFGMGALLGTGR